MWVYVCVYILQIVMEKGGKTWRFSLTICLLSVSHPLWFLGAVSYCPSLQCVVASNLSVTAFILLFSSVNPTRLAPPPLPIAPPPPLTSSYISLSLWFSTHAEPDTPNHWPQSLQLPLVTAGHTLKYTPVSEYTHTSKPNSPLKTRKSGAGVAMATILMNTLWILEPLISVTLMINNQLSIKGL